MDTDIWTQVLRQLQQQMTRATFNTWLAQSSLVGVENEVYTVEVTSSQAIDWLENRLKEVIARSLTGVVGKPVEVKFIAREVRPYEPLDETLAEETGETYDAELKAAYHDRRNAIIQPARVEQHTQYFRLKWRPLLGPMLSELIRELRQRCYFGKGKDPTRRNSFGVTYKQLAFALGVSERTLYRALERDETGRFKNEYLNFFIKDMRVLKKYDEEKGKFINDKTQFVIYLDEPLTPKDQARLSN
jgi:hypothetical protein